MEHLVVVVTQERKFEPVFGRIKCDSAWACRSVQAMCGLTLDTSQVDGVIECANHTMVTENVNQLPGN